MPRTLKTQTEHTTRYIRDRATASIVGGKSESDDLEIAKTRRQPREHERTACRRRAATTFVEPNLSYKTRTSPLKTMQALILFF